VVGSDRTAVPDPAQRLQERIEDPTRRHAREVGDEADSAGITLAWGWVEQQQNTFRSERKAALCIQLADVGGVEAAG
jgi:hypothetical protein